MIQKVSFQNFKAYRVLDLVLEPLTVLVGPNASGKTTLLQGLELATNRVGEGILSDSNRWAGTGSSDTHGPIQWGVYGTWDGTAGSLRITHAPGSPAATVKGQWKGKDFSFTKDMDITRLAELHGYGRELLRLFRSTPILRFQPGALSAASYSGALVPTISGSGEGLASVLADLKLSRDEVFDEISRALQQLVPSVQRIRIERAPVIATTPGARRDRPAEQGMLWGNRVVFDMVGAKGVAAESAGESTLMVLGLLTVLMGTQKPRLVLVDGIESSLHPVAQGKLIELLRKLQASDPGLQIIATSQSPFILNALTPDEVRMTFLAEDGFARCRRLTKHPEFERLKGLLSPGEFWLTVGESWEVPGDSLERRE